MESRVLSRSTLLSKLKDFLWTRAETSVEGKVKRFLRFGELDGECWLREFQGFNDKVSLGLSQ